ncbi:MAG: hypothetical protein QOH91_1242 [Mycobacterium sp.]|nr:hypothetical protein [Mycobacterium sp.]
MAWAVPAPTTPATPPHSTTAVASPTMSRLIDRKITPRELGRRGNRDMRFMVGSVRCRRPVLSARCAGVDHKTVAAHPAWGTPHHGWGTPHRRRGGLTQGQAKQSLTSTAGLMSANGLTPFRAPVIGSRVSRTALHCFRFVPRLRRNPLRGNVLRLQPRPVRRGGVLEMLQVQAA